MAKDFEHEIGASSWRLKDERYHLVGGECSRCGHTTMPAREICPNCNSDQISPIAFAGNGEVLTYTVTADHPDFEDFGPITIALVKLEEGAVITAQITEPSVNLTIGSRVEVVTRILKKGADNGIIKYGYKFREKFEKA